MTRWYKTSERTPVLPKDGFCQLYVVAYDHGNETSRLMIFERRAVHGKLIERWKQLEPKRSALKPDYWTYLPEPPKKRKPNEKGEVIES